MRQETAYLEGATPTKFGPKPLKRERGPSFSNINLDTKHTEICSTTIKPRFQPLYK